MRRRRPRAPTPPSRRKRWPPNWALPPSGCCVTREYGPVERAWILSSTRCSSLRMGTNDGHLRRGSPVLPLNPGLPDTHRRDARCRRSSGSPTRGWRPPRQRAPRRRRTRWRRRNGRRHRHRVGRVDRRLRVQTGAVLGVCEDAVRGRLAEVRLEDLADVHAVRNAERVEDDVDRESVLEERHVLVGDDLRDHALVPVTPGELVPSAILRFLAT